MGDSGPVRRVGAAAAITAPRGSGYGLARLVTMIDANPGAAFIAFAVAHAALWTVLPAILCRDLPLDVLEGVAYGREWGIGYLEASSATSGWPAT